MKKYSSFYGSVTIAKAVKLVGIDHALHACTCDDWQEIVQRQVVDAWACREMDKHTGWCVIMQAGSVETMKALYP